ncbi:hypothetical protein BN2537_3541 [Streptomyces venezuelae]|nr:hypothetical protein BN2537_3541 [Streptomyces venezuelae]
MTVGESGTVPDSASGRPQCGDDGGRRGVRALGPTRLGEQSANDRAILDGRGADSGCVRVDDRAARVAAVPTVPLTATTPPEPDRRAQASAAETVRSVRGGRPGSP